MDTAMNNQVQPQHFPPGEGKVYKIGRMTMTFTTTAEHNLAGYTLCEAIEPPQSGAALRGDAPGKDFGLARVVAARPSTAP